MQKRVDIMKKETRKIRSHYGYGFTLIELMVTVAIVAIFAAIAFPSYQAYTRKAYAAQTQQEIQKLAEQLERHKARNFTYKGFDASFLYKDASGVVVSNFYEKKQELSFPVDGSSKKYTLFIVDNSPKDEDEDEEKDEEKGLLTSSTSLGQGWAIKALSTDDENDSFLKTSNGIQCKNKTKANITFSGCGVGSEIW